MTEGITANAVAVAAFQKEAMRLYDDEGIQAPDMVLALICVAVGIIDANMPGTPADVKRAGLVQMIDGVVLRTKQ